MAKQHIIHAIHVIPTIHVPLSPSVTNDAPTQQQNTYAKNLLQRHATLPNAYLILREPAVLQTVPSQKRACASETIVLAIMTHVSFLLSGNARVVITVPPMTPATVAQNAHNHQTARLSARKTRITICPPTRTQQLMTVM